MPNKFNRAALANQNLANKRRVEENRIVELKEGGEYRGMVSRSPGGGLVIRAPGGYVMDVFENSRDNVFPGQWVSYRVVSIQDKRGSATIEWHPRY